MPRLAEPTADSSTEPSTESPTPLTLAHRPPASMPVWMSVGLALVTLGLASTPTRALAEEAAPSPTPTRPDTLWRCSLTSSATRLLCIADRAPDPAEPSDAALSETPTSVRNASGIPTRYPLDPARPYTIDLLGPATDMPLVMELAQFTLCLRMPRCRAVVG